MGDPLNVAKNANQLNEDWAQGRRPQTAAMAVVNFLRLVRESNRAKRARLIDYFFYRLWLYAESVSQYRVAEICSNKHSKQELGGRLVEFSLKYPESGNIPQFLVAQLLSGLFSAPKIQVVGGNESVFGTNTTSKKPADIWLEVDGQQSNLYEVTVKPVSKKRLDDSLDALRSTGHLNHSVTFICRMDFDVRDLDIVNGAYQYRGKTFDFIDYRSFCLSLSALLSNDDFLVVLNNMAMLIQDKNISMKTKSGWNEFFGEN